MRQYTYIGKAAEGQARVSGQTAWPDMPGRQANLLKLCTSNVNYDVYNLIASTIRLVDRRSVHFISIDSHNSEFVAWISRGSFKMPRRTNVTTNDRQVTVRLLVRRVGVVRPDRLVVRPGRSGLAPGLTGQLAFGSPAIGRERKIIITNNKYKIALHNI